MPREISVDLGNKQIAIAVDEDASLDDITRAIHREFQTAPLKPLKLEPVEFKLTHDPITLKQDKIRLDPIKVSANVTTEVALPDAKLISTSVLQMIASNKELVAAINELADSFEQQETSSGWSGDVDIVRDEYGNLKTLKFRAR